ncbi:hypothetical protein INR49_014437 [Caranx melampygus]|nr:hypothetical protein INR49_014437 [Caranx melampygus]
MSPAEAELFLLILASSTGNDKSTEQQQYGSKPQLLPLSKFPEGQKEFSSQLQVTTLSQKGAKLCEMRQEDRTKVKPQLMGRNKGMALHEITLLLLVNSRSPVIQVELSPQAETGRPSQYRAEVLASQETSSCRTGRDEEEEVHAESLCEGAKWSSRRQKVGPSHASEVVSPAGEGGTPGRQRQGENKHVGVLERAPSSVRGRRFSSASSSAPCDVNCHITPLDRAGEGDFLDLYI